jgi:hypothetical protein
MRDDQIDQLLGEVRQEPVPEPPKNMEARVSRAIRRLQGGGEEHPSVVPSWLLNPSFAMGFVAATLGVGLLFGSMLAAHPEHQREVVREVLSLDAFRIEPMGISRERVTSGL